MKVIGGNTSDKHCVDKNWAKKIGGDPVSFKYRSYHRRKVELFWDNTQQTECKLTLLFVDIKQTYKL